MGALDGLLEDSDVRHTVSTDLGHVVRAVTQHLERFVQSEGARPSSCVVV